MKVVADADIPYVKEAFIGFGRVVTAPAQKITKELLKDASILLVRSVTKVDGELLEGTTVKFVATATTGTDHIDTSYLENENIGFASTPGSNANSVAEYIVSALLHCANEKKCKLNDCTIGIIGVGNVGSKVLDRVQALGMRYLLNDPPKKRITNNSIYISLDEILRESDIVTLHVPLTMEGPDSTYHMVDREFITRMRDGALLINTSRGKVVDEEQLCETAPDKLGGIVIDVWETEPAVNSDLLELADIATPHIAGYSYDGKIKGTRMIHDSACAFFFRDKVWDENAIVKKLSGEKIDIIKSKNPVFNAVQKAYSITEDDKVFRKIIELEDNKKAGYFDTLRKNYPKRLEFSHFKIKTEKISNKDKDILSNLGFNLEI